MRFADPHANSRRRRVIQGLFLLICGLIVLACAAMVKNSYDKLANMQSVLEATKTAEALIPVPQLRRSVVAIDPKQKVYLGDLKVTATKLAVDWGDRLDRVEKSLGTDLSLNVFRVDAQKAEVELKGEIRSTAKLATLVKNMQDAGLDARIGRLGRQSVAGGAENQSFFEYSVSIVWPQ